jgi:hypothetical protein
VTSRIFFLRLATPRSPRCRVAAAAATRKQENKKRKNSHDRNPGRLQPHHRQDYRRSGAGHSTLAQAVERRSRHREDPRPLRHNGIPYKGINVVMLWPAAVTKGYACPLWLTFKQGDRIMTAGFRQDEGVGTLRAFGLEARLAVERWR